VRCVFHHDQRPSLSIDIDRGLFNCFACVAKGGARKFAELVGESGPATPPPSRRETPVVRMRREAIALAQRQSWSRPGVTDLYRLADLMRAGYRRAAETRTAAQAAGPAAADWNALARAARAETTMLAYEHELDEIIRAGAPW
jgi:hypothetical protein